MARKVQDIKKVFFRRQFSYDIEFEPEMKLFIINIDRDSRFKSENKNLDNARFSRAMRFVIQLYNTLIKEESHETT